MFSRRFGLSLRFLSNSTKERIEKVTIFFNIKKKVIKSGPVVVFMKGVPEMPQVKQVWFDFLGL
jgi:hypothetical protein